MAGKSEMDTWDDSVPTGSLILGFFNCFIYFYLFMDLNFVIIYIIMSKIAGATTMVFIIWLFFFSEGIFLRWLDEN